MVSVHLLDINPGVTSFEPSNIAPPAAQPALSFPHAATPRRDASPRAAGVCRPLSIQTLAGIWTIVMPGSVSSVRFECGASPRCREVTFLAARGTASGAGPQSPHLPGVAEPVPCGGCGRGRAYAGPRAESQSPASALAARARSAAPALRAVSGAARAAVRL